jgi:hypothetical protein
MPGFEISQNLYARISERAFAIKRDIDLAARAHSASLGPNPLDPCMARARQNVDILVEALKEIEIVPEIPRGVACRSPLMSEEEILEQEAQFPESDTAGL